MSLIRIRIRRYKQEDNDFLSRYDRAKARSERGNKRAEIVKHRKWIFISLAVIAIVLAFLVVKFT